jgi:hypothetical protein
MISFMKKTIKKLKFFPNHPYGICHTSYFEINIDF